MPSALLVPPMRLLFLLLLGLARAGFRSGIKRSLLRGGDARKRAAGQLEKIMVDVEYFAIGNGNTSDDV